MCGKERERACSSGWSWLGRGNGRTHRGALQVNKVRHIASGTVIRRLANADQRPLRGEKKERGLMENEMTIEEIESEWVLIDEPLTDEALNLEIV